LALGHLGDETQCARPHSDIKLYAADTIVCSRYLDMTPSKEVLHQGTVGSAHASMVNGKPMRQDGLQVGVSALLCLFLHAMHAQTSALDTCLVMQEVYKRLQTALQRCLTSQGDAASEVRRPVVNKGFSNAQHVVCTACGHSVRSCTACGQHMVCRGTDL